MPVGVIALRNQGMLKTYDGRNNLRAITVEETDQPAMIWYCKAFLESNTKGKSPDGLSIVIDYYDMGKVYRVRTEDWESDDAKLKMNMDNTRGKAKAAGARCALMVKRGKIQLIGRVKEEPY